jgi:hypothetical protein
MNKDPSSPFDSRPFGDQCIHRGGGGPILVAKRDLIDWKGFFAARASAAFTQQRFQLWQCGLNSGDATSTILTMKYKCEFNRQIGDETGFAEIT